MKVSTYQLNKTGNAVCNMNFKFRKVQNHIF